MSFLKNLLKLRDEANPDRFTLPVDAGNVMDKFSGGGREDITPAYQDISIGPETPTPRTGMTLQDRLAPLAAEPSIAPQQTGSQGIMEQIRGIQNKDYSKAQHDESGNIIKPAGADRDKKWSLLEKIGAVLSGVAEGVGSGRGLLGAAQKGIEYGTDRNFMEKRADAKNLKELGGEYSQAAADEEFQNKQANVQATTANTQLKPYFERQKIAINQQKLENQFLKDQQNFERLMREEEGRNTRAGAQTKTQEVDGYLFRTYPNDPSKPMEPILDPRTGKQAFNPANVAQEVEFEDGTKAWAKGGQIVQGKFAGERQAKDIAYKENRDTEDRKVQIQKIQTDIEQSNRQYGLEVEKFKRGEATDKRLLDQLKAGIATRKAWIMSNKNLSADEKRSLLASLPNDNVVQASADVEK